MRNIAETREQLNYLETLPTEIDSPYPYVAINDIPEAVIKLVDEDNSLKVDQLTLRISSVLKKYAPENSTFYMIDADKFSKNLNERLEQLLQDNNQGVILLDRYLLPKVSDPRLFRLEISRTPAGTFAARPGVSESPEIQYQKLSQWISATQMDKITIADDVLAFATTTVPLIEMIKETKPEIEIEVLVGIASSGEEWSGIEKVQEAGATVRYITKVKASPKTDLTSGMAVPVLRDMTFLGGKVDQNGSDIAFNYPYLLPFSKPQVSFVNPEQITTYSQELFEISIELITLINQNRSTPLCLGDLVEAGYGVPFTTLEEVKTSLGQPSADTDVLTYLEYLQQFLYLE